MRREAFWEAWRVIRSRDLDRANFSDLSDVLPASFPDVVMLEGMVVQGDEGVRPQRNDLKIGLG